MFLEVGRLGSVSRAAREVRLSQPAVTQALAGLESALGWKLFERTPAGVRPTPAGTIFLNRVQRTMQQLREGLVELDRSRGPEAKPERARLLRSVTASQLGALVDFVEHGSFGGAARAAGMTRPALHRAARDLERALGATLFEQTTFGLRPTRDAQALARKVRLAAAELLQGRAEAAAAAGESSGSTVIGALPLARSRLVPEVVLEFTARHPAHTVTILDGPYESLLAALRVGAADVLVGALRDALAYRDVVQEHLFDDPLAIVVRRGHPLLQRRAPGVRELAAYRWIAPRAGAPLRRHYVELFASAGLPEPAGAIECNSLVAARALLIASDRVMLLSAQQIHNELATGQLATLPHPLGHVARSIGLTMRSDWQPTAAQRELLDLLRRAAMAGREKTDAAQRSRPPRAPAPPLSASARARKKIPQSPP